MAARKSKTDFKSENDEILSKLDIRAEYEALGVRFAGRPRSSGKIECYALGREEKKPSACVDLNTGRYHDSGSGDDLSLWDAKAKYGGFASWEEARKDCAQKVGVTLSGKSGSRSKDRNPLDSLQLEDWTEGKRHKAMVWCKKFKPGVSLDAILLAGGRWGRYPIRTNKAGEKWGGEFGVICLPCWGERLPPAGEPVAWVIFNATGPQLSRWRGKDIPEEWVKMLSVGPTSGAMMNRQALELLAAGHKPDLVIKTGGPSDMLAMLTSQPPELRERHLIVTNASGETGNVFPHQVNLFRGLDALIISDRDIAGVAGDGKWLPALAGTASQVTVGSELLPYEFRGSHGRDLRDFLLGIREHTDSLTVESQVDRESIYRSLTDLAESNWLGCRSVLGDRLAGNWSEFNRLECRMFSDEDQKRLFGQVLVPHNSSAQVLEGDDSIVWLPAELPAIAAATPGPAGDVGDVGGESSTDLLSDEHILKTIGLDVLGMIPGGAVKVFSRVRKRTDVIRHVAKMQYEDLIQTAGGQIRNLVIEPNSESDAPHKVPFKKVKYAIAAESGKRTIENQTELGVGVWEGEADHSGEPSILLVGVGEAAFWSGDRQLDRVDCPGAKGRILDFETTAHSWFEYVHLAELMKKCETDRKFVEDTRDSALSLFKLWKWQHPLSPHVAAGLAFSTWVQSIWSYRPQVAIVGPTNSGKSFLWIALDRLFGQLRMKGSSRLTAASLRIAIGRTSKIVLLDEFEQDRNRSEILEMLRSSSRGDTITRGTPGQKLIEFTLKHMAWVAAIEVGLKRAPDRNRFVKLELVAPSEKEREKNPLILPPDSELADLGQAMLAVAVHSIGRAKPLADRLKSVRIEGVDSRIIESYSVPAAMLSAIDRLTDDESIALLKKMVDIVVKEGTEPVSDENDLLGDILSSVIYRAGGKVSVSQLLQIVVSGESDPSQSTITEKAIQDLGAHGIALVRFRSDSKGVKQHLQGQKALAVHCRVVVQQLLKDNEQWKGDISQILKRIPGADGNAVCFVAGKSCRCVAIPEAKLQDALKDEHAQPQSNF